MKFETTPEFDSDFRALKREHQNAFYQVIKNKFIAACDEFAKTTNYVWPASLRVKSVVSAPGIWEMTWSFASPDGRATFELLHEHGEWRCRWRRVGDHAVFRNP